MAKIELISITPCSEQIIEFCGRRCYNSLDKITDGSHRQFLTNIIKRGHFSLLSFAHAVFHVSEISRACSHQLVRHAHLRYLQRSQRYCNEVEAEMTKPESIGKDPQAGVRWNRLMQKVAWLYSFMTGDLGVRKEDARYILPNACHTEMSIAGNLQGWFDFLRLRLGKHAQWEIRDLAKQIYQHLNAAAPSIFNPDMLIVQPKLNLEFPE